MILEGFGAAWRADYRVRFKRGRSLRGLCLLLLLGGAALQARALPPDKPLKQYGRQSWQSDTGLPQNTVHAVAQTRDGFLWLATEGGLVRFDGQEFHTYDSGNTPAFPGNSTEGLAVDGRGTLWVDCAGGLVKLEKGKFVRAEPAATTARVIKVLRDGEVLIAANGRLAIAGETGMRRLTESSGEIVAEDAKGVLWVASGREVISPSAQPGATASRRAVVDIGELQSIAAGDHGDLWVGGREGLALFRDGKRVPVDLHASVTTILPAASGEAWLGTDVGLFHIASGRVLKITGKGVTAGKIEHLYRDAEGTMWAAFEDGITRVNRDGTLQEALELPGVLSIFEDSEGDMWFGTDAGGATVLREQAFSTLTVQDGLSDDFVRAIFQDHAGKVWVGTNRGGLNRLSDGKVTTIRAGTIGGLTSNVVLALAESGDDVWVGTPDGLSRLHGGKSELFTSANGLPDDFVRSLYVDTDGSLWIGTRAGLSHYAKGRFTSYSRLDGLGSDLIGSILRTRDGVLLVGTLGGVSRFDGTGFKNFTRKDGLGGDAITTMAEDSAGTVWIAAHEAGLTRLRGGVYTAISSAKLGLPTEIYSVLEDHAGNFWMGTARGVFRVSIARLNALIDGHADAVDTEAFGVADGMKISECSSGGRPAGWRMKDGSLWFATLKGVAAVQPEQGSVRRAAPVALIEQVAVDDQMILDILDGQEFATGAQVSVPAGRERITIHYTAPSFQAPQKVMFRYMLEGFDHGWIAAGTRRTAYYTNIPAGTFRFLVEASNGDQNWSPVAAEMQFVVQPRFYRTWWFYLLLVSLICCLVYTVYRLRVQSVEANYRAVMGERNRIAREIHDTLAQGYVGVSLQLEIIGRMLKGTRPPQSEPGVAEAQIEVTKKLVKSSLDDARSSIWNLRSAQFDAESDTLPARFAASVRSKQESSAAAIRLTVTGTFRPLERSVEDELLRIGQEAISNAVRHASANMIEVLLVYDTRNLELRISDDGRGYSQASSAAFGHYGLQGMNERAAAIDAKLRIESVPDGGTSVEVKLGIAGSGTGKKKAERG